MQLGNLTEHLLYYKRDLNAMIPESDFKGYILLDFEHWRADWNSTPSLYRTKSLELAGNNKSLAKKQYEAGAKKFMLATIGNNDFFLCVCACLQRTYFRNNEEDEARKYCGMVWVSS